MWHRFVGSVTALVALAVIGLDESDLAQVMQREQNAPAAIRERRAEWNRAAAAHDPDALARTVAADVHVSGPVQQIDGRSAMRAAFNGLFTARPDLSYRYEITRIDFYAPWGYAAETGTWEERWTERGDHIHLRGTYLTLWRQDGDVWRQQSETFVPLTCTGGRYCDAHPVIAHLPLAASAIDQYVGLFRSGGTVVEIRREDNELVLRMSTGLTARLLRQQTGEFQLDGRAGRTVLFSRLEDDRFTRIEIRQRDRTTLQASRLP